MKAVDENRRLLRAKIVLDHSMVVEFYERPKDIDFYDSTVVISRQGEVSRSYEVGNLIKHQALSLANVSLVPSRNGEGILVCEYVAGAVGARVGFAIVRFSPDRIELYTLPLTDFGKVVVFRNKPQRVELWSALSNYVGLDAEPRPYATRFCKLETQGYVCGPQKRRPGRFAPEAINEPGIEIRR
jgi:hypothetical protein